MTEFIDILDSDGAWSVIRNMNVRGAPLIAIVAALGLATDLNSRQTPFATAAEADAFIQERLQHLRTSRPTAVNLFQAADRLEATAQAALKAPNADGSSVSLAVITDAERMLAEDMEMNRAMGMHGADAIIADAGSKPRIRVLTHCNTGSLATAAYGTALGVVRALQERAALEHVYCTETRPYNQGARLTAYEIVHDELLPGTLVTDSMVAALMARRGVDCVVVGADRIAMNGDTANKIGTFQLAIVARHFGVPFYVAAPTTTIDRDLENGEGIVIEERRAEELTHVNGTQVAASGIGVWNPAFDVTPADLISGIVTENGVLTKNGLAFDCQEAFR